MLLRTALFGSLIALPLTADVGSTTFRWEKRDATGNVLAIQDGPWACVYDRYTGLLWEVKSDNEGLHYAGSTYFKNPDTPRYDGGCVMAPHKVQACGQDFLLAQVREKAMCGYSDWRIPSASELESLIIENDLPGHPQTAIGLFPHTGRAQYWSTDERTSARGESQSVLIDFNAGERQWVPDQTVARLRLVRGQPRSATRFD